jgi:hypothetical protein
MSAPDISEMLVIEYPSNKTLEEKLLCPNSVPLVLGILDKPREESKVPSLIVDQKPT